MVKRLRRKLTDNARTPRYIVTEPGIVYRMVGGRRLRSRPQFPEMDAIILNNDTEGEWVHGTFRPRHLTGVCGEMDDCVLKRLRAKIDSPQDYKSNILVELKEVNDLASVVRAVTAEAYALADKKGRPPERIKVEANFDMDPSGRLTLNQSRGFSGAVKVKMELAPQAAPPGLRLIADYAAKESVRGQKKSTRKQVNHTILYRRQGGYCTGCGYHFQPRNLTIDHVAPRSTGGSGDISNFQLLCDACNQLKGDGTQEELLAELRARGCVNPGLNAAG